MAGEFNRLVKVQMARNEGEVAEAVTTAPESPADSAERQQQNLRQWREAFSEIRGTDAEKRHKRSVMLEEFLRGRGTTFPGDATTSADLVPVGDTKSFQFIEPRSAAPAAAGPKGFSFVEPPLPAMEAAAPKAEPRAAVPQLSATTPGGAVTGVARVPAPRADLTTGRSVSPAAGRLALEVGGSVAGEVVGGRVAGMPGAMAGSAVGGGAGSLVSEMFDPTTSPVKTAVEAALTSATGTTVGQGAMAGLRAALGNPTAAGKRLKMMAETRGEVPLPGAVMEEGSLAAKVQAIGQADVFMGQRVADKIKATSGLVTQDVGQYVNDFLRTKGLANKAFADWDIAAQRAFGTNRVVYLPPTTLESLEPIIKVWESRGLSHQFDPTLLRASQAIRAQVDAAEAAGSKVSAIKLSIAEAEAVRSLFYNNSRFRAGAPSTGLSEIGGEDLAKAYRREAEVVSDHIQNAINAGVKDGRMPLAERANLQGAGDLWKTWKQGERIIDEIVPKLEAASREGRAITSDEIFRAVTNMKADGEKISRNVISGTQENILTGFATALRANEESGKTKMFSWMVRGNQANLMLGGAALGASGLSPVAGAVAAAVALTPTVMSWLVTNPTAARLMMAGLKTDAGTAEAARIARQFLTLGMKEGIFPPDRQFEGEEAAIQEDAAQRDTLQKARPEFGPQSILDFLIPSAHADEGKKHTYQIIDGMFGPIASGLNSRKEALDFAKSHGITINTGYGRQAPGSVFIKRIPLPAK